MKKVKVSLLEKECLDFVLSWDFSEVDYKEALIGLRLNKHFALNIDALNEMEIPRFVDCLENGYEN